MYMYKLYVSIYAIIVLDLGRPSISGSIRSIKCTVGLNVLCKRDWCVVEMYPEEQGFGPPLP